MQLEKGLCAVLFDIGHMTDGALAQGNLANADASAALAVTLLSTRGAQLTPADVAWVASWGEQFYRWQLFARGGQFYGELTRLAQAQQNQGPAHRAILATGIAFAYLGGAWDADPGFTGLSLAAGILGHQHPLVGAALARHASRGGAPVHADPAAAAPALPGVSAAGSTVISDEDKALWLTLAFFMVGAADGKIADGEYLAWKNAMTERKLPDVFGKYGAAGIKQRLDAGELQKISARLAGAPREVRLGLVRVAFAIAAADGKIDKDEIASLTKICQLIGLSFDEVLKETLGNPKAPKEPEKRSVDLTVARCEAESALYMDLRGATVPRKPQLAKMGDKSVNIFDVQVDGQSTLFAFEHLQPGGKLGAGGVAGPSKIIGPHQFLAWADVLGKQVPGSPEGLRADQRQVARAALVTAAECLEEIVKFIPAGGAEVPEAAFTTDAAKRRRAADRDRFARARLEAAARAYRGIAERMPFGQAT